MKRKSTSKKSRIRMSSVKSKKRQSRISNEGKIKSRATSNLRRKLESNKKDLSANRPKKSLITKERKKPVTLKPRIRKGIVVRRSSGRQEKFDTNRLTQTVSRSGVPYFMARGIANATTRKIKSQVRSLAKKRRISKVEIGKSPQRLRKVRSGARSEETVITASQVRNLVAEELRDRNRPDIAASYTGNPPAQIDLDRKPNPTDIESISDKVAGTMNKALYDPSKQKRSA